MLVTVEKHRRLLTLWDGDLPVFTAAIALGRAPEGPKLAHGDGRTPEGRYRVCLVKEQGRYGLSLGLSYPNAADAQTAFAQGRIDHATLTAVLAAEASGARPPWGSPLGGEIYLHEGPTDRDWTQGCIALAPADMAVFWAHRDQVEAVDIRP